MTNNITIIHHDCPDGFCGAYRLRQYFLDDKRVANITLTPAQYGDPVPLTFNGETDHVIIVDFSYSHDDLVFLKNNVKSIIVLDHHKTAEANLRRLEFCYFNMKRCGAEMAEDFIYSHSNWEIIRAESDGFSLDIAALESVKSYSKLTRYVADRDLWKWAEPFSHDVCAWIASFPRDPASWEVIDSYIADCDNFANSVIPQGHAILRFQQRCVESICEKAIPCVLPGDFQVMAVNTLIFQSEVGERLKGMMQPNGVACMWFVNAEGRTVHSLRGDTTDVSEIAKQFPGGGGHPKAAGFTTLETALRLR